jgi:hypothetical protein
MPILPSASHELEEIMEKVTNIPTNKDEAALMKQPQKVNHWKLIKSQVLAKIGKPPRLDRVEVSLHHGSKYRVNIWQQPEPDRNLTVTIAPRIGLSYYLTVSDTGEIIDSNPPLTTLCPSA